MTKNKNDIESLFDKLLGSANAFNTINTFNENNKNIFKNKDFKIEDLGNKLNDVINNVGNSLNNTIEEINNNNFETEIDENLKIKESKDSEEVKELKQQIANEISNVEKIFTDIVYKEENDFNLEDITKKINPNKLKEAMVLSEILGKPVSKKRRNRNRGYRQL